jgi:hypothetical protein
MLGFNIRKHLKEFQNYVLNNQYELGDGGILFPKANVVAAGIYTHDVNGLDERIDRNVIPDEGLNHILNVIMLGTPSPVADWYCMLHSGSGTPDADTTLANYHSLQTEITSGTEGYSEATRVMWVGDAVDTANTEVTNAATPATFTIVTTGSLAVNGAALTSISAKGSQSGTLMSAGKFSAQRNLSNGDEFNLKYKVDFDSV